MVTTSSISREERLAKVWQSLQTVEKFQQERVRFGVDRVNLHVEDVDGEWLENWGEDSDGNEREAIALQPWFEGQFPFDWQPKDILGESTPGLGSESGAIARTKILELEGNPEQPLAVTVTLRPRGETAVQIGVKLQPLWHDGNLPEYTKLVRSLPEGDFLDKAIADGRNRDLTLDFETTLAEPFTIEIVSDLGNVTLHFHP
ncbi:hypothetical protein JJD41_00835 [Oxynema sp. CENA135]|uniref:hypothetical protein n=1 Tax=Oxynema sp. CENA135 TaxID=984206 RepID=UPI00190AEA6D|nr:hypothetical protein [Oxynema sp. CENA135]MBK4728438.1 hypothetical protein [Oxynema sp. CENA135]